MIKQLSFTRLTKIAHKDITAHMSDPRLAEHMPLLTTGWNEVATAEFVTAKEAFWERDGLGHWAILSEGKYVGWGGFQKEGTEWDYGLVLRPDAFGLGTAITNKAIAFAIDDKRIPFVTFLLPPSRKKLGALKRLGAKFVEEVIYNGEPFQKFRLETKAPISP